MPFFGRVELFLPNKIENSKVVTPKSRAWFTLNGVDFYFIDAGVTGVVLVRQRVFGQGVTPHPVTNYQEGFMEEIERKSEEMLEVPPVEIARYNMNGPVDFRIGRITVPDMAQRRINVVALYYAKPREIYNFLK